MHNKHILVVGGAGYIGSHMVNHLYQAGYSPIVLDNLSSGYRDAVIRGNLIVGDCADTELLEQLFSSYIFWGVIHFASHMGPRESIINPLKYYENNVTRTLNLLTIMEKYHVNRFVFSSTATVYGIPQYTPIDEEHAIQPLNPYAQSKRMVELMLEDFFKGCGLHYVILRYFNVAGADMGGLLCEKHEPETHLLPKILEVALGESSAIKIYGRDYPTVDGTCIRDYVHVSDICSAHLLALEALIDGAQQSIYNLGTGDGYSVQQIIDTARQITKKNIFSLDENRREGDVAILVADPTLAKKELNWEPRYSDLETMVTHAWQAALKCASQVV